ncbi:glutathione S-transferase N-terminal domain-containing protein [Hydrogenophaga sp. BPS33]|uniref:glutathione S-transferase N-terminal domain-containing protein n=1 Tax=Hydrogenophaga sp. BPS33 TaxID=2651974 RepID=UPI00131F89C5|nr:glutathione S-transferase N-terminal domain-containing protein [Hydrogenophaga sp. BPS33]QHE87873.1 glutathione S-transferase [Hydrogenophaga sp. BPS33]
MTRLLLKGVPGSPYTRKMLAVLRYRHIAYQVAVPNAPHLAHLPTPKVELQPTFYLPNAAGDIEAVTDSTPLIRRFEMDFAERAARPHDPVIAFIDSVLEDYADEWLTKAMFHYRWHFDADIRKAGNLLPRWRRLTASDEEIAGLSAAFTRRQIDRLRFVGSNPITADVIEASYRRFLSAFEAHLKTQPFLMGHRPGASDFAVYGQLSQLAHFDPTSAALALEFAPRACAWVGLVDDLSGHEPQDAHWVSRDALPPTLMQLLAEAGRTYVPVMLANARALKASSRQVQTRVDGLPWVQGTFPYQGKCLRWLREEFAALSASDQASVNRILESSGTTALVHEAL